jgi:thiol-disulfide isomerase/thioredoxin
MQSLAKAPNLRLTDIRGRRIRLSDYRGKVVLLNFWATWCPPCRTEIPDLIRLQNKHRDQGLRIIGITYPPQTLMQVRRFIKEAGVNYPIGLGKRSTKALFDKSEVLPVTVIIDPSGNVRGVVPGILYPEEFEEKIKPLLLSPTSNLCPDLLIAAERPAREPGNRNSRFLFKPATGCARGE